MHDTEHPSGAPIAWPARILATLTAGYACVLVWATHHPKPQDLLGPKPPPDKLLHVGAYAILGALVAATLVAARRLSWGSLRAAAVGLGIFAVLDEATQPLPWFRRTADPIDWLFDAAGIAIGIVAIAALAAAGRALRGR